MLARALSALLFAFFVHAPAASADTVINMQNRFQQQLQTNWCWAATSSAVINYYSGGSGTLLSSIQCRLASRFHTPSREATYCCNGTNGAGSLCNKGFWPDEVLAGFNMNGGRNDGQLTDDMFDRVVQEIHAQRPVIGAVGWQGTNQSHVAIVYGIGFGGINGGQAIYLYDPTYGRQVGLQGRDGLNSYGPSGRGGWISTIFSKRPH